MLAAHASILIKRMSDMASEVGNRQREFERVLKIKDDEMVLVEADRTKFEKLYHESANQLEQANDMQNRYNDLLQAFEAVNESAKQLKEQLTTAHGINEPLAQENRKLQEIKAELEAKNAELYEKVQSIALALSHANAFE